MRVLFIARYLHRVNHRKVAALAAQPDVELVHLAPSRWGDELGYYEQELREPAGYPLLLAHPFPVYDIHRFLYWPPHLFLRRVRPEIIHFEEEPDSLIALQIAAARRLWAPGADLIGFTWQNIRRKRRPAVEWIAQLVLRQVNAMIAGNQEAAEVLREQGYRGPIRVVPQLGVDLDTFQPPPRTAPRHDRFTVGFVGRLVPQKGVDILLEAVRPLPAIEVLLVGEGPMRETLEAQVHAWGMAERVRFVPAVPRHEVPRFLHEMDALVLPSRTTPKWKEQFGHVLIKAMACGVPVIGSDSGAIPEVIGPAGLIFPEGDAPALQEALRRLAEDPGLGRAVREAGLARVRAHYTHARIAAETAALYREVMEAGI